MGTGEFNAGGKAMNSFPDRGGGGEVEILPVASCYRNWDKLRPAGPQLARMHSDVTFTFYSKINYTCMKLVHEVGNRSTVQSLRPYVR